MNSGAPPAGSPPRPPQQRPVPRPAPHGPALPGLQQPQPVQKPQPLRQQQIVQRPPVTQHTPPRPFRPPQHLPQQPSQQTRPRPLPPQTSSRPAKPLGLPMHSPTRPPAARTIQNPPQQQNVARGGRPPTQRPVQSSSPRLIQAHALRPASPATQRVAQLPQKQGPWPAESSPQRLIQRSDAQSPPRPPPNHSQRPVLSPSQQPISRPRSQPTTQRPANPTLRPQNDPTKVIMKQNLNPPVYRPVPRSPAQAPVQPPPKPTQRHSPLPPQRISQQQAPKPVRPLSPPPKTPGQVSARPTQQQPLRPVQTSVLNPLPPNSRDQAHIKLTAPKPDNEPLRQPVAKAAEQANSKSQPPPKQLGDKQTPGSEQQPVVITAKQASGQPGHPAPTPKDRPEPAEKKQSIAKVAGQISQHSRQPESRPGPPSKKRPAGPAPEPSRAKRVCPTDWDDKARTRVECILREQLDLELYLKQKEINTITERLQQSEAMLSVIESAIRSQQFEEQQGQIASTNTADGYYSYFHEMMESSGNRGQHPLRNALPPSSGYSYRQRPRRAAAQAAQYMMGPSGTLYARRNDGQTVRMVCLDCRRDEFASMQSFLNHSRLQHGLEFPNSEEAISVCGVVDDSGSDEDSDEHAKVSRATGSQAPLKESQLSVLSANLNAEQKSSITDALEFINKPRVPDVESSDDGSDSDSQADRHSNKRQRSKAGSAKSRATAVAASAENAPAPLGDTRFHVIRRVMLGNTSRYFEPEARPAGKENSTHKWTIYLRNKPGEQPIEQYVKRVRVFLHPSYRPDDIVDLSQPKFELTRWGWGEFPVRVQIFFVDKRNKPVDLIHLLKLDNDWSGNTVLGAEKPIDFEIDRRGLATGDSAVLSNEPEPLPPPPSNPLLQQLFAELCRVFPLVLADALPHDAKQPEVPEQILELVSPKIIEKWTWGVAVTSEIWRESWPLGRRLAAEAHRNRALMATLRSAGIAEVLGASGGSVNTPAESSASAAATGLSERVVRSFQAILTAAGVDSKATEDVLKSVRAAATKQHQQSVDMLSLWLKSNITKPLRADKDRGPHKAEYAWSLKRWLRSNGFVPMPALSSTEEKVYLADSAYAYMATAGAKEAERLEQLAKHRNNEGDIQSRPATVPRYRFFCHGCGALESRDDPRFIVRNGELVMDAGSTLPPISYCSDQCENLAATSVSTISAAANALAKLPQGWDATEEEDEDAMLMIDDDAAAYSNAATPLPSRPSSPHSHAGFVDENIAKIARLLRQFNSDNQSERQSEDQAAKPEHKDEDQEATAPSYDNDDGNEDADDERDMDTTDANAVNDMEIDWIWSTLRPLKLRCAPASRFLEADLAKPRAGGQVGSESAAASGSWVQLPNSSDEAFGEALDQRLVVGRLLLDVAKLFMRDLIGASDRAMRQNRAAVVGQQQNKSSETPPEDGGGDSRLLMMNPLHVLSAVKRDPKSFDVCSNAYLADELEP